MARVGLANNRKFRHLAVALGGSRMLARGALELLWESCYEVGDPYVGTSDDIEAIVGWTGEKGALTRALLGAGAPKGEGFIEEYAGSIRDKAEPHYQIHDFFHHCPGYVQRRHERELERTTPQVCTTCGAEFYTLRADGQYCSGRCRMRALRSRDANVTATNRHVTDNVTAVTAVTAVTDSDGSLLPRARAYAVRTDLKLGTNTDLSTNTSTGVLEEGGELSAETLPRSAPTAPPKQRVTQIDTSPVVLTFPVIGKGGPTWSLRKAQVDRWTELYPTLDIVAEARKASAWIEAADSRRKTFVGMERFLVNWLNRAVEMRRGGPTVITGSIKTAGNKAAVQEFLRRQGHVMD